VVKIEQVLPIFFNTHKNVLRSTSTTWPCGPWNKDLRGQHVAETSL
jgi:hypothetical protein